MPYAWLLISALGLMPAAWAAELEVRLEGWTDIGPVRAALVRADQPDWPAEPLRQTTNQGDRLSFTNLPAGRYAIQLYQDSNGNGQLDLSPRGIPLEPSGFSGNPPLLKGKPKVLDSAFAHGPGPTLLTIRLRPPRRARSEQNPRPPANPSSH